MHIAGVNSADSVFYIFSVVLIDEAGTHCLDNALLGVLSNNSGPISISPNATFTINGKLEIPPNTTSTDITQSTCYGYPGSYVKQSTTEDDPVAGGAFAVIGLNLENQDNGRQTTKIIEIRPGSQ